MTLTTVSALSVDPSNTKLACYGMHWPFTNLPVGPNTKIGYVFVLDASDGAIVSGLLKMAHYEN